MIAAIVTAILLSCAVLSIANGHDDPRLKAYDQALALMDTGESAAGIEAFRQLDQSVFGVLTKPDAPQDRVGTRTSFADDFGYFLDLAVFRILTEPYDLQDRVEIKMTIVTGFGYFVASLYVLILAGALTSLVRLSRIGKDTPTIGTRQSEPSFP